MRQRTLFRAREFFLQAWHGLLTWNRRRVTVAVLATIAFGVLLGIATVLIPNPIFARDIPPVWWNYPVWIVTSIMSGMLLATYLRRPGSAATPGREEARSSRFGLAGGMLAWFAVGCPVCNKIALLALGYAGAITWFAPMQPFLAVAAMFLSGIALLWRLRGEIYCAMPKRAAKPKSQPDVVR